MSSASTAGLDENVNCIKTYKAAPPVPTATSSVAGIVSGKARAALGDISNRNGSAHAALLDGKKGAIKALNAPRVGVVSVSASASAVSTTAPMETDNETADDAMSLSDLSISVIAPTTAAVPPAPVMNALFADCYVDDIVRYLRGVESKRLANAQYMSKQTDLTGKMREILIDWLVEVHHKFHLTPETLYLTTNIIDRFLERRLISRNKLQLVGCTAMLLASKYEEIYAPEVMDFVHIADRTYTREQIISMETIMLNALSFNLTVPSAYRFIQRFLRQIDPAQPNSAYDLTPSSLESAVPPPLHSLTFYLLELTLQDIRFLQFAPSMCAAAALALACTTHSRHAHSAETLEAVTEYSLQQLRVCGTDLYNVAVGNGKYRAVKKKYAHKKYNEVAKLNIVSPWE